jgi:hypothetical protein
VNRCLQIAFLAGSLLFAGPLLAQLRFGGFSAAANGTLASSYTGDYGNLTSSDHSIGVGGSGTVTGYYFNPNFFSFTASPYYNNARDSSTYRSISNGSGVDSAATIFGGSSFPGTVSYSKQYNSQGTFNVPGLSNLTTHGDSDSVGLSWAARLRGLPTLTVSFQNTDSENSIYGVSQGTSSSSHSFNLNSSYQWLGFGMGASYYMGGASSEFPELFSGSTQVDSSQTTNHGYSFNVSHRLPWNGSSFASFNSSSVESKFLSTDTSFTVDTLATGASMHPNAKLSMTASMGYSSNLSGSIEQELIAAGGVVTPSIQSNSASHSYSYDGALSYIPIQHVQMQGSADRRVQEFLGQTFGANVYTGQTNYSRPIMGGNFAASVALEDATLDNSPQNTIGFTANTVYGREVGRWRFNGTFNYQQGVQTLLVTYTNSSYGFGGSVRRKFQRGIIFSASYGGSRTGLTGQSGAISASNSLSTGLSLGRWAAIGANYQKSSGSAIQTAAGLVTTPIPSPLLPASSIVLYGGTSYSYSIGSSPLRRLSVSASYSKSDSNSEGGVGLLASTNIAKSLNIFMQYQFRKMFFTAGFNQLTQGVSGSGLPPQTISAFYISISRWFNFF